MLLKDIGNDSFKTTCSLKGLHKYPINIYEIFESGKRKKGLAENTKKSDPQDIISLYTVTIIYD